MVYFKILLNDKRQKEDNIYPVTVRVTYQRNNTTLNTGIRVSAHQWDTASLKVKSVHPNAQAYNKTISDFYSKVQNIAFQLINDSEFTFETLREKLNDTKPKVKKETQTLFKEYAEQLVTDMLSVNQTGNAIIYRTTINRFTGYVNNINLKFTDINYTLLEGFKRQLLKEGMKQNTISNYFRTLRAIYNKAIKAKVIDRSHYPFLDIQIKTERTAKRAIAIDDLVKIVQLDLKPKSRKWHARNYFLLSFSLIGASFTDIAYFTSGNIKKGRLIYKRRKTGKELSIKLLPFTQKLLASYTAMNPKYLLPVVPASVGEDTLRAKALIAQWIKTTNKWLSKIAEDCKMEDELTTYVARHTWATTAKRLVYSIEVIAEAMGHEHGNRITNIYLDSFDQSLIDEVNAKAINAITI